LFVGILRPQQTAGIGEGREWLGKGKKKKKGQKGKGNIHLGKD